MTALVLLSRMQWNADQNDIRDPTLPDKDYIGRLEHQEVK